MKLIITLISMTIITLLFLALNFHVIEFEQEYKFLRKTKMTFEDTYVDARGLNKFNLLRKPALVEAGMQHLLNQYQK